MTLVEKLIKDGLVRPSDRNKLLSSLDEWLEESVKSGQLVAINSTLFKINIKQKSKSIKEPVYNGKNRR